MSIPWWEFIVRAAAVYIFVLLVFKLGGKRQIGQLAPFDFALLLIFSNAVQNSMNGGDNSLVGGLISASSLALFNFGLAFLTYRSKFLSTWISGVPQVLIHNGKTYDAVLSKEKITHGELMTALRGGGCASISEVKSAILEVNGNISVIKKEDS